MKPAIKYNIEYDFLSYITVCANVRDLRKVFNQEQKTNPELNNKDIKKKRLDYYKEAEHFYNDAFTYMQRNELDMFFKQVSIFEGYLMYLAFDELALENQTLEDFKAYVLKELELEERDLSLDILITIIKEHYDQPNSFGDYNKEAELILEMLKDERMFNSIFKNAIYSLRQTFMDKKYKPMEETIKEKLDKHNQQFTKDPVKFILNLTTGIIKEEEIKDRELMPYITFFTHYKLMFKTYDNKALIVYHQKYEAMNNEEAEKELIQSLLKFLSDPKRYQMVQMLSKEKWYANELAKEFKITPATMSYHVNKMFSLGLISFEPGDQNKMYMQLDKKRLNYLLSKVTNDLVQ